MPNETIICLQEVLKNQLDDILSAVGPEWAYIDYGRDDEPFTSSDRLLGCVVELSRVSDVMISLRGRVG